MRGPLSAVARYLARLARGASQGWNDFWFTPAEPALLGLIRILTGMMLLYNHAIWGVVLNDFYGRDSWLSQELIAEVPGEVRPYVYTFWSFVPQNWDLARPTPSR